MSTLGAVNSQHGVRFNTMVCDVRIGGYEGRIRGYPNKGKNVFWIGPREMVQTPYPVGFITEGVGNGNKIAFCLSNQSGSTAHRIKQTIYTIKSLTKLFPVKILTLHPETFVYRRGTQYFGYYEGQPLSDVMSAIWFGTGPALGNGYGDPFWPDNEPNIIAAYAIWWMGDYKGNTATVFINFKVKDSGIIDVDFESINIHAGGIDLVGKPDQNREIIGPLFYDLRKSFADSGFAPESGLADSGGSKGRIWFTKAPCCTKDVLLQKIKDSIVEAGFQFR